MNKMYFESKVSWVFSIVADFIVIALYLSLFLRDNNNSNILLELLFVFCILYLEKFFLLKRFKLTDKELIIEYLARSFCRTKIFELNEIQSFTFLSNDAVLDISRIVIKYEKNKDTFYFNGDIDYQKLIDELRKMGKVVVVNSHIWK